MSKRRGTQSVSRYCSITTFVFAIAVGSLIFAPSPAFAQGRPAEVIVEPIVSVSVADTTPVIGRLVGTVESSVATRRPGIVEEVLFDIGDTVKQGEDLVRLDDALVKIEVKNTQAALEAAKAGVAVAEARLKRNQLAFQRQERLRDSAAFSRGTFEDLEQQAAEALSELARAQAQVAVAEAAVARAVHDDVHSVIKAPFDSVIISKDVQPGQFMVLGGSIGQLLDLGGLEVLVDMPVELLTGVEIGREMDVRFLDGTVIKANVRTLLPTETVSTRTRPVRLSADLSDLPPVLLADNKSVTVKVPTSAPREAVFVPKDALIQGLQGEWRVFVAEGGKAVPRGVRIGAANEGKIEVLSGLEVGEFVVVRGNERLRPNQAITPRDVAGNPIEEDAEDASQSADAERQSSIDVARQPGQTAQAE
ncbi:MAG: efflux RND transporter periplasmic adaptor subunit [Pseudomonadota bacterium]